jgi:hypothetical protein
LTPEGYDDVADELEEFPAVERHYSPERTDAFKAYRAFERVYLSPSEVQAENATKLPPETLFCDPLIKTPVAKTRYQGRPLLPPMQAKPDLR